MKTLISQFVTAALFFSFSTLVYAVPIVWTTPGSGDWTTASNWNPAQVPQAADDASINNGGTANLVGQNVKVGDVAIGRRTSTGLLLPHGFGTLNATNSDLEVDALLVGVTQTSGSTIGVQQGSSLGSLITSGGMQFDGDIVSFSVVDVGRSVNGVTGTAQGVVTIQDGDILTTTLTVGRAESSGNATGDVVLQSGGITGFGKLAVGTSTFAATGTALGNLSVNSNVVGFEDIEVGVAEGAGDPTGHVEVGGSLELRGLLSVGVSFQAGAASGTVNVAGDVSGFRGMLVGNSLYSGATAGGDAIGSVVIGGSLLGDGIGFLEIATSFEMSAAEGSVEVGNGISGLARINLGIADGIRNVVGELNILSGGVQGNSTGQLHVATVSDTGNAEAAVTVHGDISGFSEITIARGFAASTGDASGLLELVGGDLTAATLLVGVADAGANTGNITGVFDLNDNLANVSVLELGDGSTIMIDIAGLQRGVDFGAIDAGTAILNGTLDIQFLFDPLPGIFDLVVSDTINGIAGDFDTVTIAGLAPGTLVSTGVVVDGGVERYRLEIGVGNPIKATEPHTLIIILAGLVLLYPRRRARTFTV